MASKKKKSSKRSTRQPGRQTSPKVGSDPKAVTKVGGKGDFGAAAANPRERAYVSEETRLNDPGAAKTRIKVGDGARETGVGSNADAGTGAGSGGDIDIDIIGAGFGGVGLAQSGPDRTEGPDMTEVGGSEPFAAPGPKGHSDHNPRRQQRIRGSTVDHSGGDITTTGAGQSAGSVTNPEARNDDSFAADIEEDEAIGGDNSASDNR